MKSLVLVLLLMMTSVFAGEKIPNELENIGIDEKLGQQIDLALTFKDENGESVRLQRYFDHEKKPVLLLLAYYGCPNLCNFFLNGVTDALRDLKWTPGKEFEIVTVSFDPRETTELAFKKKAAHIKSLGKNEAAAGWHFLVAETPSKDPEANGNAKALATQLGFKYRYDKEQNQFAHTSAAMFLTPSGKISRYLGGISFSEKDFRLALTEASGNKIGNVVDHLVLFCYNYDPKTRKYSLYAMNLMRVAAAMTVIALAGMILTMRRRSSIKDLSKKTADANQDF